MDEMPKKIGRYEVESIAGRGAMGVVYRATDPLIHRVVAIKKVSLPVILGDEQRREFNERFFREAQAAGNLHHPNIVTIFDVGEDNGVPFMAQEFIEGESLSKILKRDGAMNVNGATNILRQMADALHYAHTQGVVHRDVKPDNILIDKGGRAVLTDFGVARLSSSDLTRTGEVLGTPHFMSPEQVLGEPVDGRSDLFSLGVVFYLLLTGKKPYSGDSVTSVCYQIVHSQPALPEGIKLLPGTAYVLEKLMAKSKDDRFADGAEILETLDQLQDGTVALGDAMHASAGETGSSPTQALSVGAPPGVEEKEAERSTLIKPSPVRKPESKGISTRGLLLIGALGLVGILLVGLLAFFAAAKFGKAVYNQKTITATEGSEVNQPVNAPVEQSLPPTTGKSRVVSAGKAAAPVSARHSKTRGTSPSTTTSSTGTSPGTTAGKTSSKTPVSSGSPANPGVTATKPSKVNTNTGATATTPSKVNARIGLIVEGRLHKGLFQVLANGKKKLTLPFQGIAANPSRNKYGFRIVKVIALKPGRYTLTFLLSSPRPRPFFARAKRTIDLKSGDEYVLKIEPRRFPERLKVTLIEHKRAQ